MHCTDVYYVLFTLFILLIFVILINESKWWKSLSQDIKENSLKFSPIIKNLLGIGLLLIIFSVIAPYLFTREYKNSIFNFSAETGAIGDTIGGIMNPFIALVAVIVTGLAFYVQYQANQVVITQFKDQELNYNLDKFENRIFKLVDNYNDIVNKFELKSRESEEVYYGKDFFYALHQEFKSALSDIKAFNIAFKYQTCDTLDEYNYKIKLNKCKDHSIYSELEIAYLVLYYGVSDNGRKSIKASLKKRYNNIYIDHLLNYLSFKPTYWVNNKSLIEDWTVYKSFCEFLNWENPNESNFIRYHNGHQSRLGHYFRHLYMIIQYVDNFKHEKNLYYQKWDHVKFLRALFSNHEQLIFFLNSISIFGRDWELNKSDENLKYITKYDLIKNIPESYRIQYFTEDFYPDVEYEPGKITSNRRILNEEVFI